MSKKLNISFDSDLLESISADFDLRAPNKEALRKLIFTLDGDYDPEVMQVLNLATGVGKTYLMAAFIEYLRQQGIGNVVIITPGKTVQRKTECNFTPGNPRYIAGAHITPEIVTPQDYSAWVTRQNGQSRISYGREIPVLAFIFNIQQFIAPSTMEGATHDSTKDAERRKPRKFDESAGVLFEYLKGLNDLVVIADECHLYSSSAVAFNAAIKELDPAASIGLTASVLPEDYVIYKYPLFRAIQDEYVKAPVLAFRKGGYGSNAASEEQQLRDALQLRNIKQAYYDSYAAQIGAPHLNAVVFVVCADVDHATQIATLLRSPEYLGSDLAVLQVDSKHDDDITQDLLENLDQQDSPVLAVVSVNKLKEGWDVKNIAVVVTLRAMASEVLTQQTMGRGLRLPFGKYTGVWQIDQLDIIAHQSFQELLAAENILVQFGLEEAVTNVDKGAIDAAIQKAAAIQGEPTDTTSGAAGTGLQGMDEDPASHKHSVGKTQEQDSMGIPFQGVKITGGHDSPPSVGVRTIDVEATPDSLDLTPVVVQRNPRFAKVSYKFPVTKVSLEQPPIDLSEISDKAIENAAKKVTSTGDVLYRKEIVASLGKKLHTIDAESAEVDSVHVDDSDAAEALIKLILNMQLVPSIPSTVRYVERFLVPKFMKNVSFSGWTVKSLSSARTQLQSLIKDYIVSVQRGAKEIPAIHPKDMILQDYMLPLGEKVYDPIDRREQFVRGRVYSGWIKSLYTAESFDSYTGEYKLAQLLNTSPHIVWWHRLHQYNGAYIYYNAKDRYFPDFVALDDGGVHWIIEGKSQRGVDDDVVKAKRVAAETLVRRLVAEEAFDDQLWGYLIAFEDDIARSDSWNDLKAIAQPVCNTL